MNTVSFRAALPDSYALPSWPFRLHSPDAPLSSLSHATPQLDSFPSAGLDFAFTWQARRFAPGRIEFVILRTGRSPPAALHHASLRRSCIRLQAGERFPGEDLHLSDCAYFQAHHVTPTG